MWVESFHRNVLFWLPYFPLMFSRFFHLVACARTSFFFSGQIVFHHFVCLFTCWKTLEWLYLLAIMSNSAMNIGIQIPVQVLIFNTFGSIPGIWITEWYSNSTFIFVHVCSHVRVRDVCMVWMLGMVSRASCMLHPSPMLLLFPKQLLHFTSNVQGFWFLYNFNNICFSPVVLKWLL
jgi:hypothetical protein